MYLAIIRYIAINIPVHRFARPRIGNSFSLACRGGDNLVRESMEKKEDQVGAHRLCVACVRFSITNNS